MGKTSIQWASGSGDGRDGHSINPLRARDRATGATGHFCLKISDGCKHCYSARLQPRFHMHDFIASNGGKVDVFLDYSKLDEVERRRKPTGYFWCDMTDMFLDRYTFGQIAACFNTMLKTPQHRHMVLTKRPARMMDFIEDFGRAIPDHIMLGVSVERQSTLSRIDILKDISAVRFISFEPLLEDLGALVLDRIHWAIIGGESGSRARPMDVAWARSIISECRRQNIPVFMKQLGRNPVIDAQRIGLQDSHGGDMSEWADSFPDLAIREYPALEQDDDAKKRA